VKLLDSLLDAIVRLEGDALVMHVGEKPYVVTASSSMNAYRGPLAWGQVELSSRVLTFDAVSSMLGQILPADQQQALTEFGAIEHDIPSPAGVADRFTVIAARGGEDVWVELRRRPTDIPQAQSPEAEAVAVAVEASVAESPAVGLSGEPTAEPAAEIELDEIALTAKPDASRDEQPAADIELETHESIVVAIPGQAAEEFALNGVSDNAIQIVDDEPQGVPTEEEVDAMLGANAASLLASGMAGEVVSDDDLESHDDETEIVLPSGVAVEPVAVSEVAAVEPAVPEVEPAVAEPAWQLSPPPAVVAESEPTVEAEAVSEAAVGTPLFSEEAVLAAAPAFAPVEASSESAPTVEPAPVVEFTPSYYAPLADAPTDYAPTSDHAPTTELPAVEIAPVAEVVPVAEVPSYYAPVVELGPIAESAPVAEAPPPVEAIPHLETPPYFAPVVETPAHYAPVTELGPIAEFAPVVEVPLAIEHTLYLETPPHVVPAAEVESIADPTPIAELTPVVELAPVVEALPEFVPVAEATAAVEHAPIPEVPLGAEFSPVVETPSNLAPVAEFTPVVEISSDFAPVGASADYAATVESSVPSQWIPEPVVEDVQQSVALVFVPTPVTEPAVEIVSAPLEPVSLQPAVEPQEFVATPVSAAPEIVDARREAPRVDEVWMPDAEFERPPLPREEDLPRAEDGVANTMNAGAQPAVSEPTPQLWTPSAPEMPMEVTPELQGQEEPVAHVSHWAAASPGTPVQDAPEPVLQAEADAHAGAHAGDDTRHGVVVPLARTPIKPEPVSVPFTPSEDAALMHTLRVAAARGASTVYVVAQSKPMIRIDGEIGPLESEPTLTAADVDRLVMELAPPRRRDALQNGPVEWLCDVPEIGRVRCMTFKDHRGPGVLFRMFPPRAISADQLGLTPEVQALCQQSDGLVLVTGARASGKSTLLNAFVDLINRTRSDHVITIESQIGFVHESRRSFISQRESRGDSELAATYARAALREDPDVMMIEDLKSPELVSAALEAAESGRLVLASVPASSTIGALERLIEVFPADRRAKARTALATALRGVIAQVLLRRAKGGRVAAREILLNTPAVSQLVLEGKMFQLPVALDSGRRHGMVPLTDSLAAHVRDGTVQVAEAYRKALDRAALVALLKREGIDTSFAERLA
jgi:twitching motility protein PilT